tara:strand:- start:5389 stop:6150 length:762 start_codon:yes stop_codon:yes gene_type:complete
MFDLERGHQTIGSKEHISKMFGFPVLSPTSWVDFQRTIAQIYTTKKTEVIHKIGGLEIPETSSQVIPKNGTTVDAIVLDTFSELSKKYMRSLTDKDGKLKLQDWGRLKNTLDVALEFISRLPGVVICTCHSKTSTMDDGTTKLTPYIDGSTKEDISKWFDFVFYCKTTTAPDNSRVFKWVTKRSEMYDHAKDRTSLLPVEMDQDYSKVIAAANERGFENCRILIIGSPGSGKTFALQTLTKVNEEDSNENTND